MGSAKLMGENAIMLSFAFLCMLIILRAYMGLTVRIVLSKKERRKYQADYSWLNRWFFCSVHKIIKDKYSKYEKRTIRYTSIMKVYKAITIVLHIELALVLLLEML